MFKIIFTLMAVTSVASAHVEVGVYTGKNADGRVCRFEVKEVRYENNQRHPLNERVVIAMQDLTPTLSHPAIVSLTENKVGFDHDQLSYVKPTPTGAIAYALKMDHTPGNDGPKSLHFINSNFSNPANNTSWVCSDLVHQ